MYRRQKSQISSAPVDGHASRWLLLTAYALPGIGLLLSFYTALHHVRVHLMGITDAVCNVNAFFNCDRVALSSYSELFHIPMGVWGGGYFLSIACGLLFVRRNHPGKAYLWKPILILNALGVTASFFFTVISVMKIGSLCLICTLIHIVILIEAIACFCLGRRSNGFFSESNALKSASIQLFPLYVVTLCVGLWIAFRPWYTDRIVKLTYASANELFSRGISAVLDPVRHTIPIHPFPGGEDISLGKSSAKVTIVEFIDFNCPVCQQLAIHMEVLRKKFGENLWIVFKHAPFDTKCFPEVRTTSHPGACDVAGLGYCVAKQEKFEVSLPRLFQLDLVEPNRLADELKVPSVDSSALRSCLASPQTQRKIREDSLLAAELKISATPTLFLNERRFIAPLSRDNLEVAIRLLLQEYR